MTLWAGGGSVPGVRPPHMVEVPGLSLQVAFTVLSDAALAWFVDQVTKAPLRNQGCVKQEEDASVF